nr:MAG TPA: hypothetical protein [Bacteriophage sp.]
MVSSVPLDISYLFLCSRIQYYIFIYLTGGLSWTKF